MNCLYWRDSYGDWKIVLVRLALDLLLYECRNLRQRRFAQGLESNLRMKKTAIVAHGMQNSWEYGSTGLCYQFMMNGTEDLVQNGTARRKIGSLKDDAPQNTSFWETHLEEFRMLVRLALDILLVVIANWTRTNGSRSHSKSSRLNNTLFSFMI